MFVFVRVMHPHPSCSLSVRYSRDITLKLIIQTKYEGKHPLFEAHNKKDFKQKTEGKSNRAVSIIQQLLSRYYHERQDARAVFHSERLRDVCLHVNM